MVVILSRVSSTRLNVCRFQENFSQLQRRAREKQQDIPATAKRTYDTQRPDIWSETGRWKLRAKQ